MESSLLLTLVMSLLMGILAKFVASALGVESIPLEDFVFISIVGGTLAGLVLILINVLVAGLGFRRNWDIDNISAPLITAAGDVVTLPMLFLAAIIVMAAPNWLVVSSFLLFLIGTIIITVLIINRTRSEVRRIFVQSSPVLTICILLDIAAGITIDQRLEGLVAVPALLVLIPPFLEDANALGGLSLKNSSLNVFPYFSIITKFKENLFYDIYLHS
jgi:mgtE-like transporter